MKQLLLHPQLSSFQDINWKSKKLWQLCSCFLVPRRPFEFNWDLRLMQHPVLDINKEAIPTASVLSLQCVPDCAWCLRSTGSVKYGVLQCGRIIFLSSYCGCSYPSKDNFLANHQQSLFGPSSTPQTQLYILFFLLTFFYLSDSPQDGNVRINCMQQYWNHLE